MVPVVPSGSKLKPHNYTLYYIGPTGYQSTLIQMGYVKQAWPDSLHHKKIGIDLSHLMPELPGNISPEWYNAFGKAKILLILLVILL